MKALILAEVPKGDETHIYCCFPGEAFCGDQSIEDDEDISETPFGEDEALCFACITSWCRNCGAPATLAAT